MLKDLFNTAISLIFRPSEAWKYLSKKQSESHDSFLTGYVYPFMGLIILAAFLGVLFTGNAKDLQIALKESIVSLLSVFGGFFLASYLVNEVWHTIMHREPNMQLCQRFVGYSSSLLYSLNIILSLFPDFFFLRFLLLYTIYIVWEGVVPYLGVKEPEQLKFAGLSTAIIIITPLAIAFILRLLMPGLNS